MTHAWGMNKFDQVVGQSDTAAGQRALFWDGSKMWNLQEQTVNIGGWAELTPAQDINDLGQITGYGIINGQTHAFVLAPVIEP